MFLFKNKKNKLNKGFTLVEMLIALGLFITVMTMSMGSLVGIFNSNSKSQSVAAAIDNLNYSIDTMTRNIRFSNIFHCGSSGGIGNPQSCNSGDTYLAVSSSATTTVYRFNGGALESSSNGGGTFTALTGSNVTIQSGKFYVFNTTVGDDFQPYVLIVMRGFAGTKPAAQTTFEIETAVSQRALDI